MIGIDPSLNATGLAWVDTDGTLSTHRIEVKSLRRTSRLVYVREALRPYLEGKSLAVYEDYAFGAKGSSVFQIGEMGGVLKTLCYDMGLDVLLVPPSSLKMFIAGKGNADKDGVAAAIEDKYGMVFRNSDEADAFALLKLGQAYCDKRIKRAYPEKVRDSLDKCEWVKGTVI